MRDCKGSRRVFLSWAGVCSLGGFRLFAAEPGSKPASPETKGAPGAAPEAKGAAAAAPQLKVGSTLENLQTAFNGESNAHAKYLEYAKAADKEGYAKVASLFRAAAQAEQVHADNHDDVIKRLKGRSQAEIKLPPIKSTAENLDDAIKGETYEAETMYPAFIEKAKAENLPEAVRTFNYAQTAETGHAKLYKEAKEKLAELKGPEGQAYYVCPTCGWTVKKEDFTFKKCPVCFTAAKMYEQVK
ncbi:MAG: ferritin-like domain-containing protein [Candidatus Sumerlaeota bacterium]|nr:ferritin-like domain-containing protein [Candidatus Sumerlaeota bacterium]